MKQYSNDIQVLLKKQTQIYLKEEKREVPPLGKVLHLLLYEILFGIFSNLVWGNVFYCYSFDLRQNSISLIWTSAVVVISFVTQFSYILVLYWSLESSKGQLKYLWDRAILINQVLNYISLISWTVLITTAFYQYVFTQKFKELGNLSELIRVFLIWNAALFIFVLGSVILYVLSNTITQAIEKDKYIHYSQVQQEIHNTDSHQQQIDNDNIISSFD